MNKKNVYAVYFSATGVSKKSAVSIAGALSDDVKEIDLTIKTINPEKFNFSEDDIIVISAPVYAGKVYKGALDRFRNLKGNNTPSIVTVTYGNRNYDHALLELSEQMISQGFTPIAHGALVGEHTFGEIEVGRPNEKDFDENRAFAEKVMAKLRSGNLSTPEVPGDPDYKNIEKGGAGGRFRPKTDLEKCTGCKFCAMKCPEQAIDYDDVSKIDNELCISCFRCIKSCPAKAKYDDDQSYVDFAKGLTERLAARRENEYFF